MRKIILIVHTSMDGYAAGIHGEFDDFDPSPENLDFVCSLTDEADAVLAGRVSYQMLNTYWPTARDQPNATPSEIKYSNWFNDAEKIVLSRSITNLNVEKTTIISDPIADTLREIKTRKGKNILLFGSPTSFETLNELDMIDEYWVILYPVFFGKGIPYFSRVKDMKRFTYVESRPFSKGELAMHYIIKT